jgi:exonuclease SbcD
MRLVHAADLHLDSPLRGLSRLGDADTARTLRAASRRALENLVELVIKQEASLLLLAGDVYDGDWNDYGTGRFFIQQMGQLHDLGIRVVMVSGNHDAESEITRSLRLPPNVTALDVVSPQSVVLDDAGVVVHGQGFARKAVLDNLAAAYPDRHRGLINIGLLHSSVNGQEGHERYAPCSLDDLLAKGYDYFALGHVHRRAVLAEGEHTVAYSGNLQGRHPRETGPKGALLVDLEPGRPARVDFRELDVARWESVQVPVADCRGLGNSLDAVEAELRRAVAAAQGRLLVVSVVLTGPSAAAADLADSDQVREEILSSADRIGVTVEKIDVHVEPPEDPAAMDDDLRAAVRAAMKDRAEDLPALRAQLRGLDGEVGRLLREAGLLNLAEPQTLTRIVSRAAASLESQLAGGTR